MNRAFDILASFWRGIFARSALVVCDRAVRLAHQAVAERDAACRRADKLANVVYEALAHDRLAPEDVDELQHADPVAFELYCPPDRAWRERVRDVVVAKVADSRVTREVHHEFMPAMHRSGMAESEIPALATNGGVADLACRAAGMLRRYAVTRGRRDYEASGTARREAAETLQTLLEALAAEELIVVSAGTPLLEAPSLEAGAADVVSVANRAAMQFGLLASNALLATDWIVACADKWDAWAKCEEAP